MLWETVVLGFINMWHACNTTNFLEGTSVTAVCVFHGSGPSLKRAGVAHHLMGNAGLLSRRHPPTIDDLKSLPTLHHYSPREWAIYVLILEKKDARPAIYVGSATNATLGVASRFSDYDKLRNLSVRCQDRVDNGYQITRKALLCTSRLPPPNTRCVAMTQ